MLYAINPRQMSSRIHVEIRDFAKLKAFLDGKEPFFSVEGSDVYVSGFEVPPPTGWEPTEKFPNCCKFHENVVISLDKWYEKFPHCCNEHAQMTQKSWFKKGLYDKMGTKVVNLISYTEFHISQKINSPEWYKEITDYFEYCIDSFGNPSVGSGWYYEPMKHWVMNSTPSDYDFTKEKRNRLFEYLLNLSNPKGSDKRDINILMSTINKWKSALPNLPIFEKIKTWQGVPFELMIEETEYNQYSKTVKAKLKTKSELVSHLTRITKYVLSTIERNSSSYSNSEHIRILTEEHNLKQKSLLNDYSKGEKKYVKVLKAWLENEKSYLSSIQNLIQEQTVKMYGLERRTSFDKDLLKIFLRNKDEFFVIRDLLEELPSAKNINITENTETDLTAYPSKPFTIDELVEEVELALDSYYSGNKLDPIFESQLSGISDEAYDQIIEKILLFGKNMEKLPRIMEHYKEEAFRDYFLPYLNSISSNHSATGETFNKKGKSDILIQDNDGKNVFIAECKLWGGQSQLHKAIDQLIERYVNWRDEGTALIVFNKTMKKFSELLQKAEETLKQHPQFDSFVKKRDETSFSFIFKNLEDPEKKFKLELMVFMCV